MLRNCWLKWFENRMQYRRLTGRSLGRGRRSLRHRPTAAFVGEALEARTLLTTYFVDTTADVVDPADGQTSLREAITMAEADATADMIRFAPGLEGAVFNITQGPLPTITQDLQLLGTVGNAQTINGAGLVINASGAGDVTTFAMNSVNINLEPNGAGLQIDATDDGVANVIVFNSRITNSAAEGINFVAHTGGVVNLTLASVQVISNGDVVQSAGIKGAVGVGTQAGSLTMPGKFATANLDFSAILVTNQFLEAFRLDVATGGVVTTPNAIRNANFSGNGGGNQRSGVHFEVSGAGSSLQADFDGTVAHNATGTGYEFLASAGADLDVAITSSASQGAKADAMTFLVDNATATIDVDGFTALSNGDNGVEARLTNGAVVAFNTFNNVNINNALNTGLMVGVLTGSTLSAFNATDVTVNNSGVANNISNGSGVLLTTTGNSESHFNFTNLTSTNNLIRGVQVGVNQGGTSTKTFNNLVATGNLLSHPVGIGVGNGSTLDTTINGGVITSAGVQIANNNIYMPVTGASTSNLTIDGVTMDGSTSSGLVASFDGPGNTGTIDISNTTSIGNNAVGIAVFARNGGQVDGNFENLNVSGSGQTTGANGMRLEIDGPNATGDFIFDGVNADGVGGTGISLLYNNLASGSVNQFDNVSAQNTGGDGVNVFVRGVGTTLSNFVANTLNVSGAGLGTSQTGDGLDITVAGPGAIANFDLHDVTANVAGGRGIKLQVENTATAQVSLDDFAADGNGLEGVAVDVGVVVAGAQLLASSFTNGTASNNGQAFMVNRSGFRTDVRGSGSTADLAFAGVFANSNTDDGLALTANTGAMLNVDLSSGVSALGNLVNGVDFQGDGPATIVALTSTADGNLYTGNGGVGLNVLLTNQVTANEITVQGEASLNQNDGVRIADDGSGVTINSLQVSGNSQMNNNQGDGLVIDLDGTLGLTSLDLSSLTLSDNVGDQIHVALANMSLTDISLDGIMAVGSGAGGGGGDGIELTLDNTQVTNSLALNNIVATNNGEDGLELSFANGAAIPLTSAIDIGTFNDNGQHGVNIDVLSSTISLNVTNSLAVMGSVASMSRNAGNGLNIQLDDADMTMDTIDSQTIIDNGGAGVEILTATPSDFVSSNSFTNNDISGNGSFGFHGVFNGGTFDISIGSRTLADMGNTFDENTGAAINIDMVQDALGRLAIVDNVITGTLDDGPVFNGEAIYIRQLGTVNPIEATNMLDDVGAAPGLLIQNNRIGVDTLDADAGNAGYGITFDSQEASVIDGLEILGNQISNNGLGGIHFARRDAVDVNGFLIDENMIQDNSGNGIHIEANNSALAGAMQVMIGRDDDGDATLRSNTVAWLDAFDGNVISGNTNGIQLHIVTDSQLDVDMNENMIIENGNNGILLTQVALSGDTGTISGNWDQNLIADNTNIGFQANALSALLLTDSIIGAAFDQFGNTIIDGNGSTGVEINSSGNYQLGLGLDTLSGIDLVRNGRLQIGNREVGHGIDIQGQNAGKNVSVFNSLIRDNFQDGVEILTDFAFMQILLQDNRIVSNAGRGVDALTRDDGTLFLTVQGTNDPRVSPGDARAQVNSNGEEGIYIVNTPANNQSQSDFSYVVLDQDGPINDSPDTIATIDRVAINFNGNDIGQEGNRLRPAGSGLVVRVGSSVAVNSVAYDGGFASNQSGVEMQVTNNYLEGNVGDGMFFHGYRATDPSNTGASWPNTGTPPFNNAGYQSDPLARLDIIWGVAANGDQNVFAGGDSLNANNTGRRGTPNQQAGAFYQTTDQNFKSRVDTDPPFPDTPGPFDISNRRRNAQRQAIRNYPDGVTNLGPGNNPNLLYPGMGDSTFRVSATSGNNADLPFAFGLGGFNLDDQSPIQSPNDINGTGFTGPNGFFRGELPFGWGTF